MSCVPGYHTQAMILPWRILKKPFPFSLMPAKCLKEQGISLCYHIHGYEFRDYEGSTLFDLMVKKLDPNYVNFEMDVFWVKHPGQDPVALLKKYPGRFPLMHLKDRQHGTANSQSDMLMLKRMWC
jgi:sugar phosphate isomerase/epimerase